MNPPRDTSEPPIAKALAHPLRAEILAILQRREASPTEIAQEIGAPLGNVAYHVRQLVSFGLLELVRETPRRGALEHHYRASGSVHVTRAPLTLDDRGREELAEQMRALSERADRIAQESDRRLSRGSRRRGRRCELVMMLADTPPGRG
ncbi:MAG: helix-turn-helix transcriptional regulator [Thermoleophilaceae bacterium]|nr:helix-turn-helix transcriptional regulator [Thermoleophilaceae bacterium]